MAQAMRQQLCDDAMTMLVLWATHQDYDAAVEALLNEWAGILGIAQEGLAEKIDLALGANLQRPVLRRYASMMSPAAAAAAAAAGGGGAPAGAASGGGGGGGFGSGDGGAKRVYSGDVGGSSKKAKVSTSSDLGMFEGVTRQEAMVGRKVKRYWPADAAKNKGDPWFTAVVTDYDPVAKVHVLTYSLGTQKEEREDIDISKLHQGSIDFTSEWIDLERWYSDPKRRERSYAVKISKYLKARSARIAPS